jgi:hypothetical protein
MIPRKHLSKILYAASATLVLAACADRPSEPNATSSGGNGAPGSTEPSFTTAVGFTSTLNGRGNLGTFHVKSKVNGYDVQLRSKDNTDIAVADIVVVPGGHSGWHYHPGPVLVVVKSGAITFYHGNDPTCTGKRHPAGTAFVEEDGAVGIARNEEAVETTVVATFFVPKGGPTRIDAAAPGNCRF